MSKDSILKHKLHQSQGRIKVIRSTEVDYLTGEKTTVLSPVFFDEPGSAEEAECFREFMKSAPELAKERKKLKKQQGLSLTEQIKILQKGE